MKTCSKCGTTYDKIEGNFWKYAYNKTGYNPKCKKCEGEYYKKWKKKFDNSRDMWDLVGNFDGKPLKDKEILKQMEAAYNMERNIRWQDKKHESYKQLIKYL